MATQLKSYDLAGPSAAVYRFGVRLFLAGCGVFIFLISLPLVIPALVELQQGVPVADATLVTLVSITAAVFPAAGLAIAAGLIGAAECPVAMSIDQDRVWFLRRNGRRSSIDWRKPRLRLVLWDQSEYAARAGTTGDPGFRLNGLLGWKAVLTRAAFEAIIQEATRHGLSTVRVRPSRWSVAAATAGTIVYQISRRPPL